MSVYFGWVGVHKKGRMSLLYGMRNRHVLYSGNVNSNILQEYDIILSRLPPSKVKCGVMIEIPITDALKKQNNMSVKLELLGALK